MLKDLISNRHRVRQFLPTPIPQETIEETLSVAQLAPANYNFQPWRAIIVTGDALVSLKKRMDDVWAAWGPDNPPVPKEFMHHKEHLGAELYGKVLRIGRGEHEKRNKALALNFQFYGAPAAVIVYMDERLSNFDMLSVGIWMQNFTLSLRTRGVEACYMASVAGYPELLKELGIPDDANVLSGIAPGYEDEENIGNTLTMERSLGVECHVQSRD